MAQQFPQKFGPYTLHALVGRGGMAEIYRATMPGIGGFEKTVAIKKILPHLTENEEFITMLIDEARIIVSINHFNIAQVYDLGKIDESYYIAMEYIHGVDLADVIKLMNKRGSYVPVPHTAYIGSSICAGLHVAHSKTDENGAPLNIVHRDVSPHNVLLSFAGDVKIIDFGVAKASVKETHTKMGVIKGKLLYMAPEQATAKPIDGRADLFAAGLIMYKMLTNRLPFQGDNEFQIYNNILTKEITPPRVINPEVPEVIDQIIMKLLARDPDERYQDGYSAKQDLDRALHQIAPGYTVNRLSRFIDENFALPSVEVSPSNPGGAAPMTPSGNNLASGQQNSPDFGAEQGDADDTVNMRSDMVRQMADSAPGPQQGPPGAFPPGPGQGPPPQQQRASVSASQTGEFGAVAAPAAPPAAKSKLPLPPAAIAVAAMAVIVIALFTVVLVLGNDSPDEPIDPYASLPPGAIVDESDLQRDNAPQMVTLAIRTNPDDARVFQNGEVVGITPIELQLQMSEDPVSFRIEKAGYEDLAFNLAPWRDREQDFDLIPLEEGDEHAEEEQAAAEEAARRQAEAEAEAQREREAEAAARRQREEEEEAARRQAQREAERRRQESQPAPTPPRETRQAPTPTPPPPPPPAEEEDDDIIDPFAM